MAYIPRQTRSWVSHLSHMFQACRDLHLQMYLRNHETLIFRDLFLTRNTECISVNGRRKDSKCGSNSSFVLSKSNLLLILPAMLAISRNALDCRLQCILQFIAQEVNTTTIQVILTGRARIPNWGTILSGYPHPQA